MYRTGWLAGSQTLPTLEPEGTATIYRMKVQLGEAVKVWTPDIFIHSLSQNRMVAFWSICYYRMSQGEEFIPSL